MEEQVKSGRVNIDGSFYIKLDDRNYTLCQSRISNGEKTKGQEMEDVIGYFSDFESLFRRYFKEQVVTRSVGLNMELKEFIELVKEIKEDIKVIRRALEI